MTIENITEIQDKLKVWRDERHITRQMQQDSYLILMLEELKEYEIALKNNNINEQIDALCDMAVVTLNALDIDIKECLYAMNYYIYGEKINTYCFFEYLEFIPNEIECKLKHPKCASRLVSMWFENLVYLGYSPYLCMLETIKEISSRKGSYDEKAGKWIKDKNQDPKTLYKADYKKAKIS